LHNFYEILSISTRLYADFKFSIWSLSGYNQVSYKHFPAVGAFFHKFSIASSGETTDRNKEKFEGGGGAKMVKTFSITMPSMVSIVGRAPAVEEKV